MANRGGHEPGVAVARAAQIDPQPGAGVQRMGNYQANPAFRDIPDPGPVCLEARPHDEQDLAAGRAGLAWLPPALGRTGPLACQRVDPQKL
jgi:hypothetical protein